MPNPKGTPENLKPIQSTRDEPLIEKMNIRMTKKMKEKIQQQDDPPEFCRKAIQKALDEETKSDEA
jgi:hypothetical protein